MMRSPSPGWCSAWPTCCSGSGLSNQRWRQYERFLINENRWRAQRYGVGEKLMDFGKAELVQYKSLADELA
jgi:gamma-glutamyl:cysteine ligase YbdK (ATP-grasp superfamily)